MKALCVAAAIGVLNLGGWALSAEDADQQTPADEQAPADQQAPNELERLCRELGQLVRQYYPQAAVVSYYDKKSHTEGIHFQYNTQTFLPFYRDKDGSLQPLAKVRGPYVGGIWCDMALMKGRYAGKTEGAEEGVTDIGSDFYNRIVAPYSKKLDRHIMVNLRYPGGTPPQFLKQFDELVKDFERYVGKPAER